MKGKCHAMNEFRNMHAISEWLLSLCRTCAPVSAATRESKMVGKIRANPLSSASPRGVPSSYCCMGTATYAVSSKEGMVLVCHECRSLPRHQWTPKRSCPQKESGVWLFWMWQLPLVVAVLWGRGETHSWGQGGKTQGCSSSNLNQAVPGQPIVWGQSSAAATSIVTMVVGDPPVLWLAFPGGCSQMECAGTGFESTLRNSNLLLPHSV